MDSRPLFQTLYMLAEDNAAFFRESASETALRFVTAFMTIQEHARCLEPVLGHFATIYHIFDLDERTPANGYRSLAHTVHSCLAHIIHKSRYVAANRRSIFFRSSHNCAELEAYCSALTQLRALVYLAQRLLTHNRPGCLFHHENHGLSEQFLREYTTMHKGCFYGRCMGFQFAPSIRPFLQTIAISLVSFGENYKRHDSGISVAAGSLFTSGKFAIDPELRGTEFERITQNLDVHFWKSFWNLTETELLASLASMTSTQVRVSRALLVPPETFELPLAADPKLMVTITPPVAHTGPGVVQMRLISSELREGQCAVLRLAPAGRPGALAKPVRHFAAGSSWEPWQNQKVHFFKPKAWPCLCEGLGGGSGVPGVFKDSDELNSLVRPESTLALELHWKTKVSPPSPFLVVHFHGGGFVAQTSKSHEPYLKSWAQELGAPILSIDYSLAPEAPFPRALEECFYAYCWALKNCHLLGSTAERVCLAGDSAGGNLCITVSMRAAAFGIKMPDGIMAAYPATLLLASASPSRLLTLLDPLLPLSVLSKCLSAYAGMEPEQMEDSTVEKLGPVNMVCRDTALLFRDLRLSASGWLNSLLEISGKSNGAGSSPSLRRLRGYFRYPVAQLLSMLHLVRVFRTQGPALTNPAAETVRKSVSEVALKSKSFTNQKDSRKTQTCQNLSCSADAPLDQEPHPSHLPNSDCQASFFLSEVEQEAEMASDPKDSLPFPDGFEPLRSDQPAGRLHLELSPVFKNPFMSPLLAPDSMLKGLPPVHIVACALDPMLDDSVMFARRLRALDQPVTLRVVQDLPHGFLSLSQLCRETQQASAVCTELIRDILLPSEQIPPPSLSTTSLRKHRKLERACQAGPAPSRSSIPSPTQESITQAELGGLSGAAPDLKAPSSPKEPKPGSQGQPNEATLDGAVPSSRDSSPTGRGVGA